MMYKCGDCGEIFPEHEIAHWKENRGEFWGMPAFEEMSGCPFCHSGGIEEFIESEDEDEEYDG